MRVTKGVGQGIILFFLFCQYLFSSFALATNHIVRINEIMTGLNGDSSIQFVEVTAADPGQKDWGPMGALVGRAMLVFFDANGVQTGRFVLPSNPPAFGVSDNVLFATQAFEDATGLQPDFTIPPLLSPNAGKVCFRDNPDNSFFTVNICLSYGGARFTGNTENGQPANPAALTSLGSQSLSRINFQPFGLFGEFEHSNADFALSSPTPASSQATVTLNTTKAICVFPDLMLKVIIHYYVAYHNHKAKNF